MAERHASIWWKVKPYTMTSVERIVALCQSIAHLENHRVPGAIVECGVLKGGSMMAAALALKALESTQRQLYLYDTSTGGSLGDVKQALMQTRYPWEKIIFVEGRVEAPAQIALLCLNTRTYESTLSELEHLYPRLADGGILIVDDGGAKLAVDQYFHDQGIDADLRTVDDTGRLLIKKAGQQILSAAA
ncbi:MAG: hypothetical protein EXR98_05525 [Gemmataceae bacterium]|nr:hypothetical protein [Gemmataceae bacterium]